jgi:ubiquinone/menaquinone biosynthesis C-methylase UbiE
MELERRRRPRARNRNVKVEFAIGGAAAKRTVADGYRAVAPGWDRWRLEFELAGAAQTTAVLSASRVRPGIAVLDVGCGVGEPALKLASLVAPGQVVAIDLVREMTTSASAAAARMGLSNITFKVADAEALPFPDGSFDLVTSRAAVMHFPCPAVALAEARRVLRPGGRSVFTALGAPGETAAVLATIGVIRNYAAPRRSARHVPDVYRFAVPGALSRLFGQAGFRNVHEELLVAHSVWPGNASQFWEALPDHAWGLKELIRRVAPELRIQLREEAIAALRSNEVDGALVLRTPTVIVSGDR